MKSGGFKRLYQGIMPVMIGSAPAGNNNKIISQGKCVFTINCAGDYKSEKKLQW